MASTSGAHKIDDARSHPMTCLLKVVIGHLTSVVFFDVNARLPIRGNAFLSSLLFLPHYVVLQLIADRWLQPLLRWRYVIDMCASVVRDFQHV